MRSSSGSSARPTSSPARAAPARPRWRASSPRRSTASGPDAEAGQGLPRLRRDRERHLARRDRDGRRLAAGDRRHPRDPRARHPPAGRGPLQGLHPRRGAPADRRRLERAPEADRGAAAPPRLRLLHDRPGEGAADRALALPDVRLRAAAAARARAGAAPRGRRREDRGARRGARADRPGRRGSFRDAVSTLDQLASATGNTIDVQSVLQLLGAVEEDALFRLCDAIVDRDTAGALVFVEELAEQGRISAASSPTCSSTCATCFSSSTWARCPTRCPSPTRRASGCASRRTSCRRRPCSGSATSSRSPSRTRARAPIRGYRSSSRS